MARVTPELVGAPFTVTDPGPAPPTPAIVLENPRDARDVAEVIYAASCYGIPQVWLTGRRVGLHPLGPPARQGKARGWEPVNVAVHQWPLALYSWQQQTAIVAVERGHRHALAMDKLCHPDATVYVFGPEDSELSQDAVNQADYVVEIPSRHSLYLAGAVWVTLAARTSQLGLPRAPVVCGEQGGRS